MEDKIVFLKTFTGCLFSVLALAIFITSAHADPAADSALSAPAVFAVAKDAVDDKTVPACDAPLAKKELAKMSMVRAIDFDKQLQSNLGTMDATGEKYRFCKTQAILTARLPGSGMDRGDTVKLCYILQNPLKHKQAINQANETPVTGTCVGEPPAPPAATSATPAAGK